MSRQYILSEEVFRRKAPGETNRKIGKSYGLTKSQIKQLVTRQNRKVRLLVNGYIPRPKGRPHKEPTSDAQRKNNERIKLRRPVELLRNFLSDAGEVKLEYRVIERTICYVQRSERAVFR